MRLEIDNIRFRNFLSFGSRWQEVEFLSGLNLILGMDAAKDRSNASGKSSFLETIPFALFGKVNRDINQDGIINWKNRKNCEVAITFHKGNDEYIVYRGLKPATLVVTKNGTELPVDAKKTEFQKYLEDDIYGIDFKTFMSLIYTNINTTAPVLTMKTGDKRRFMEKIFNLQLFNRVNDKANEKLRAIDKKLHEAKTQVDFNERTIKEAHNNINQIQTKIRTLSSSTSELEDAQEELKELQEEYKEDKNAHDRLQRQILGAEKSYTLYQDTLLSVETKIGNVEFKIKTLEKQVDKDRVREDLQDIKRLQTERDGYGVPEKLQEGISDIEKELDSLDKDIEDVHDLGVTYIENASGLDVLIKQDEKHLKIMEEEDQCPICGEKITGKKIKDIKGQLKINRQKHTRARKGIENANAQAEIFQKEIDAKKLSVDKMKVTLVTIQNLDVRIEDKKKALKSLDIKKIKDRIRRYKNALVKLNTIADTWASKCKKLNTEIETATEEQQQYTVRIERLESLERKIESLTAKVVEELKIHISFEEMIDSEKAKIVTLSEEIVGAQNELDKLQRLDDYLRYVKVLCRDENIKQYVISSNMPYLNKQTNHYLSYQGHGFYAIIDKWLQAEIKGPGITNASYGNLSGGEARSIDLSLQIALLDFARIKAGIFPDILITDELLDSSIDAYGLDKVVGIVKGKQIEDDLKIFLISHRKEVSEIDVDRTYLVEKTGGFSHIVLQ